MLSKDINVFAMASVVKALGAEDLRGHIGPVDLLINNLNLKAVPLDEAMEPSGEPK